MQISFALTIKLISTFVFATGIVQFFYFLNLKISSLCLLWLYSMVCVRPRRKPQCWVSCILYSCTPDRNCHTFCLGDKIASHPGVLTQANNISPLLEINQILGVVVQEKESNMVFCSRWKFPTLGMTVLSGTSAEPRFRSARSSLGLETSI